MSHDIIPSLVISYHMMSYDVTQEDQMDESQDEGQYGGQDEG